MDLSLQLLPLLIQYASLLKLITLLMIHNVRTPLLVSLLIRFLLTNAVMILFRTLGLRLVHAPQQQSRKSGITLLSVQIPQLLLKSLLSQLLKSVKLVIRTLIHFTPSLLTLQETLLSHYALLLLLTTMKTTHAHRL